MKTYLKGLASVGIFLSTLICTQSVYAFSSGINGYSSNPATNAGNNCSICHSGGTTPVVTLTGPSQVAPGTINTYTLKISGGQQNSGGLNVSVDAGTLNSIIAGTKIQAGEITHTARATADANGEVSWNFEWQAPNVTSLTTANIYSSGLSTNADFGTGGDAVASLVTTVNVDPAATPPPVAIIQAPQTAQVNTVVDFDGSTSQHPGSIIVSYEWNFGDGSTATGALTNHIFSAAGVYTVTLKVTTDNGGTNTTFRDITVGGLMIPNANAGGPYNGTEGQPVNFDGSLSTHVSAITNYIWDFGDGSPFVASPLPTATHTYAQPGTYTVTLAVQDASNITGVATSTVSIVAVAPPPPPPPPPVTDGPTLYGTYCAGCHLPLDQTTKPNRTADQIQTAISTVGQMAGLSGLTVQQIQAIADALVVVTPPPPVLDGPTLYGTYCASCHQPLDQSTKFNRTAQQITDAIGTVGQMSGLSSLTAEQIAAIADALVNVTPPPPVLDGPTLYGTYCASCHLPLDQSTKTNRTATQIQTAINTVGQMSGLSSLTTEQVQAIADALVSTTTPPPGLDGAALYSTYCATCHLPLDQSTKLNRSATQIENAINTVGQMAGISLTTEEIQAIADALVSNTTPVPTTGEELYNAYCSVCHGPGGTGGQYERVTGSSASDISSAISSESLMNSISLSSSQISLIADYLNGQGGSTPTVITGEQLYNTYCLACHGTGGRGGVYEGVTGSSASKIVSAINNESLMNSISLNSAQIQAISDYLNGQGGSVPIPTDGASLYSSYCAGCHQPLASSTKLNRTATQIQSAINTVGQMSGLSSLTSSQVQAIADALSTSGGGGGTTTPPPTDGASLYGTYCSSCHGALASSTKQNRTATQIQNAINTVGSMSSLSSLTAGQVQAIADALVTSGGGGGGGTTPTDGATLYGTYCASCHGSLASSSKLNRTATQIQNAINTVGSMSSLSSLTSTEVQAIADALSSGGGGGTTPTTGEQLYISYCQSCHGFNGTGGSGGAIVGASTNQINNALGSVGQMSAILISSADVQAIATFLSSGGGSTSEPTTGIDLYNIKCAACHGAGGYGGSAERIRGASTSQILSAISSEPQMQSIPLTNSQAQAISNYLNGGSTYSDGGYGGEYGGDGYGGMGD